MKSFLKIVYRPFRDAARWVRDMLLRPESVFRLYLRLRGVRLPARPFPQWLVRCGVLKTRQEWQQALRQMNVLHLPRHRDDAKNWDTLTALTQVLAETTPDAQILDAGAELYSAFLPALYAYGYRRLTGLNLAFSRTVRRGPICYEHGDITATRFADAYFDAAACLSVLEHGVDVRAFFAEMARIVKPGGVLIVSTDYWDTPVEIGGKTAFGAPIHVFTRNELKDAMKIARQCGWEIDESPDLHCDERAVSWDYYGLQYTFVVLSMRNLPRTPAAATAAKSLAPAHS